MDISSLLFFCLGNFIKCNLGLGNPLFLRTPCYAPGILLSYPPFFELSSSLPSRKLDENSTYSTFSHYFFINSFKGTEHSSHPDLSSPLTNCFSYYKWWKRNSHPHKEHSHAASNKICTQPHKCQPCNLLFQSPKVFQVVRRGVCRQKNQRNQKIRQAKYSNRNQLAKYDHWHPAIYFLVSGPGTGFSLNGEIRSQKPAHRGFWRLFWTKMSSWWKVPLSNCQMANIWELSRGNFLSEKHSPRG